MLTFSYSATVLKLKQLYSNYKLFYEIEDYSKLTSTNYSVVDKTFSSVAVDVIVANVLASI